MRLSEWSSDVCSSDLKAPPASAARFPAESADRFAFLQEAWQQPVATGHAGHQRRRPRRGRGEPPFRHPTASSFFSPLRWRFRHPARRRRSPPSIVLSFSLMVRSEEHTSELQSLMRISYAVFCLKKNKNNRNAVLERNSTKEQHTNHYIEY